MKALSFVGSPGLFFHVPSNKPIAEPESHLPRVEN